jgi:hypothetical protein
VVEMQNQAADLEIEVEVWQALAHLGQQQPIAPPAAPAAPDKLQGASGLSEDSVEVHHPLLQRLVLAPLRATSCLVVVFRRKVMYSWFSLFS